MSRLYGDLELPGARQRFCWIEPGSFLMGSPDSEPERDMDEVQHSVALTHGFWMANTACTQALWQSVMWSNPSRFSKYSDYPVEQVSWDDVQLFLQRANKLLARDIILRLPSEAEWEYACRAGTQTAFSFGSTITTSQANYDGNYAYAGGNTGEYRGKTLPVKTFAPNPWGLYQMHGNVWEWCQDCWDDYANTPTDGSAWQGGDCDRRVVRGGSWYYNPGWVRSAYRRYYTQDSRSNLVGFRLVCSPVNQLFDE